jgi:hypothetical protein
VANGVLMILSSLEISSRFDYFSAIPHLLSEEAS